MLLGLPLLAEWRRDRQLQLLAYPGLGWALTSGYCQTFNYLTYAAPVYLLALCLLLTRIPRATVWLGLLALGEFLGWGVRSWHLQQTYRHPVATRVGIYFAHDPVDALAMNQLHSWVSEHCPPGTPVLAYPYFARIYVHEQLRCPIPDSLLLPWLWDRRSFERALECLDSQSIPYIFHRVLPAEAVLADFPAIPAQEFRQEMEYWNARIFQNYEPAASFGGIQVWRRKD